MHPWVTIYAIRNTRYAIRNTSICPLHLSRTLYKSALFMQNKPNFRKSQMNVNIFSTKAYENKSNWTLGQNKPNSNPIKPNLRKAQMNVNSLITKDYRKNDDFAVRKNKAKTNPISEMAKMNVNSLITKDYRKNDTFAVKKNKPNSNPISNEASSKGQKEVQKIFDLAVGG